MSQSTPSDLKDYHPPNSYMVALRPTWEIDDGPVTVSSIRVARFSCMLELDSPTASLEFLLSPNAENVNIYCHRSSY